MKRKKISVIIPSMWRPDQFRECIKRVRDTTQGFNIEVVAVVDGRCEDTLYEAMLIPNLLVIFNEVHLGALRSWNRGLRICSGDPIVAIADDTYCHDDWLEEALKSLETLPDKSGVVGLNPLSEGVQYYKNNHCCHFLADRRAIREVLGGVLFYDKWYKHFASDNETFERATKAGRYVASERAIVEHRHVRLNKAPNDQVYASVLPFYTVDTQMLARRRAAGFPNDFEAII